MIILLYFNDFGGKIESLSDELTEVNQFNYIISKIEVKY
jgi:hypothetical protein